MARYHQTFSGKTQDFLIRNAEGNDAQKVVDYLTQVMGETIFLSMYPDECAAKFSLEKERELLTEWADSENTLSLVAETSDGQIAGSCNCSYSTDRRRYRHQATLAISVRKDFQSQGIGRKLMETQIEWCCAQGIEKLCLDVHTTNTKAIGLYLSVGFVVEGTLHRAIKLDDGTYRDLYQMAKFL